MPKSFITYSTPHEERSKMIGRKVCMFIAILAAINSGIATADDGGDKAQLDQIGARFVREAEVAMLSSRANASLHLSKLSDFIAEMEVIEPSVNCLAKKGAYLKWFNGMIAVLSAGAKGVFVREMYDPFIAAIRSEQKLPCVAQRPEKIGG